MLNALQRECLRTVSGAYKAVPIRTLETEVHVPPIDLWLTARLATFRRRLEESGLAERLRAVCAGIRTRLRRINPRGRPNQALTNAQQKTERAQAAIGERTADQAISDLWTSRWEGENNASRRIGTGRTQVADGPPDKRKLRLHKNLSKGESAVLIQLRTGAIGLRAFLSSRNVPGIPGPLCECDDQSRETPKHIIEQCPRYQTAREAYADRSSTPTDAWTQLTTQSDIAKWVMRTGRLEQFRLATSLMDELEDSYRIAGGHHEDNA